MKSSRFLQLLVIVVLVLTFTVSPAAAQSDLPGQLPAADEIDLSGFTVQPENFVPQAGVIGADALLMPISPDEEYIHTRTPKFYFTRDMNADRYRIIVESVELGGTLYTFTDTGVCNAYYCYLQPPTKLSTRKSDDLGYYNWKVLARNKDTGVFGPDSISSAFVVLGKGFKSEFTVNANKWQTLNGVWTLNTYKGHMQSDGVPGYYSSLYFEEGYYNFEYTVRMKRKLNDLSQNSIILNGAPYPMGPSGSWNDGIYFSYSNNGDWLLMTRINGDPTILQEWTLDPAIKKYGWNELRVVVNRPYVDLWINGAYMGWFTFTSPNGQLVGVGMTSGGPAQTLLVDYARLTPIKFAPFAEHDPAMQLGLNPVAGEAQR